MKRILTTAAVAALLFSGIALAGQTKPMSSPEPGWAQGTITAWDDAAKTFKVKDDDGKEWSFTWNDESKVMGTPAVGEMVRLKYKKGKDDKTIATHLYIGKEQMEKAGMKEGKKEGKKGNR